MKTAALVVFWLASIVTANLLVNHYGPSATPYVAFALIGADLTVRDLLHVQWERKQLWARMGLLIALGAVLTYLINTGTQRIVEASVIAFAAAAVVDTVVYWALRTLDHTTRVNASNIASAAVDSFLFPTIAFSGVLWGVSFNQWFAKIAGGVVWLLLLRRVVNPHRYYTLRFRRGDEEITVTDAELISADPA